jgi:uncharacterized protein
MQNLNAIKEMYDAVAVGNFPVFLNGMHEAIEWNEAENFPYSDQNPYIGPGAVAAGVFGRIAADWEYWTLSDLVYHDCPDDHVIVTGRYNAQHKNTAKVIKAQFTHVWTLNNLKATRFQQYTDTKQVVDAMH